MKLARTLLHFFRKLPGNSLDVEWIYRYEGLCLNF